MRQNFSNVIHFRYRGHVTPGINEDQKQEKHKRWGGLGGREGKSILKSSPFRVGHHRQNSNIFKQQDTKPTAVTGISQTIHGMRYQGDSVNREEARE